MKRILMAIMAVAIAVTFSAPSFAGDEGGKEKKKGKEGKVVIYGEEKGKDKDKGKKDKEKGK